LRPTNTNMNEVQATLSQPNSGNVDCIFTISVKSYNILQQVVSDHPGMTEDALINNLLRLVGAIKEVKEIN
jgi:hypothetical protein